MSKALIMILGAGATGKTTLSRTLAGMDAPEQRIELTVTEKGVRKQVKAPCVLGSNIAIAGNLKNTSDAIGAVDALCQTIDHCWTQRDVVIMDGFRCTNRLVRWVEEHPLKPAALFVYIELSLNNNLARLRSRRAANGKIEGKLPTKTFLNVLTFRERALGVWNYAQDHYKRQPVCYLEIPEGMGPEDSARLVEQELGRLSEINLADKQKLTRRDKSLCAVERPHQQGEQPTRQAGTERGANLREQFIQYYVAKQAVGDVDPTHYIISDIFETRRVSKEQQLWVAFLYATLYSPHRLLVTWSKFPELKTVDFKEFGRWEREMYRALGLDPDRIKFMRPPTLTNVLIAYREVLKNKTQEEFFAELIGSDPVATFHRMTQRLRSIKYVGRHTAYAWTEILIRCVKLPIRCNTIFVEESHSPRKGLLLALGLRGSDPRAKKYAWLDEQINGIISEIQQRHPEIKVDHHYMETVLCQFKNFVNGKRKVGYYLDEQAGNFVRGAQFYQHINWREIWELRARHTTEEHLREYGQPARLMERPGFIDACTQTWLKKKGNKDKALRYLRELQSSLAVLGGESTSSRRLTTAL